MGKISITELSEMVKSKLLNKGISDGEINQEILNTITEKIRGIANEDYSSKVPEEVVSVDVSSQDMPSETPGEIPSPITQTTVSNPESEELSRREGELAEKERSILEKETQLRMKESELQRKEEELEYKPQIPEALENIGPEKLFVFDMNKLSSGAESLSNLQMKYMDNPEKDTNMRDLWLEKAKKKSEVYVVKFEKVGEIEFNPMEGTSTLTTISDMNGDKELSEFQNGVDPDNIESVPTNMSDSIEPVTDVIQPMSDDMGLSIDNNSYLEELIKKHIEQAMIQRQNNA